MPLIPGQSLSFYEILGSLGVGAMGEVYRAKDTRLDRDVAIKAPARSNESVYLCQVVGRKSEAFAQCAK